MTYYILMEDGDVKDIEAFNYEEAFSHATTLFFPTIPLLGGQEKCIIEALAQAYLSAPVYQ